MTSSTHRQYGLLDHIYTNLLVEPRRRRWNRFHMHAQRMERRKGDEVPLYEGWLGAVAVFFCDAAGAAFLGVDAAAEAAFDGRPMIFEMGGWR